MLDLEGAWQRAWCGPCPDHIAYYRLEGERYIVTDLGEAVRALRLRTGCTASEATTALRRVVDAISQTKRWPRASRHRPIN